MDMPCPMRLFSRRPGSFPYQPLIFSQSLLSHFLLKKIIALSINDITQNGAQKPILHEADTAHFRGPFKLIGPKENLKELLISTEGHQIFLEIEKICRISVLRPDKA